MANATKVTDPSNIFKDEQKFKQGCQEIKMFAMPPQAVTDALAAVAVMLCIDPKNTKKLVANPTLFLEKLKTFDKDNIEPDTMTAVRKYTSMPRFNPENVRKASMVCELLCKCGLKNITRIMRSRRNKRVHIRCQFLIY